MSVMVENRLSMSQMVPVSQEDKMHPEVHQKQYNQLVKRGYYPAFI